MGKKTVSELLSWLDNTISLKEDSLVLYYAVGHKDAPGHTVEINALKGIKDRLAELEADNKRLKDRIEHYIKYGIEN